ncbi:hypothetical protein KAT92_02155, partial [Candidatus Babeliales bacterium]|nr:hypothetical protein [Candidatus Babeliales bacterium]
TTFAFATPLGERIQIPEIGIKSEPEPDLYSNSIKVIQNEGQKPWNHNLTKLSSRKVLFGSLRIATKYTREFRRWYQYWQGYFSEDWDTWIVKVRAVLKSELDLDPRSFENKTDGYTVEDILISENGFERLLPAEQQNEFELISLATGGGLQNSTPYGVVDFEMLSGISLVGVTTGNEIYRWNAGNWKTDPPISMTLDHRGGNLVEVEERWHHKASPENNYSNICSRLFLYRYITKDFRKYADLNLSNDVWIMGAGRSLYWATESTSLYWQAAEPEKIRATHEGAFGGRLFDGTTQYLKDVGVGGTTLVMIVMEYAPRVGNRIVSKIYAQTGTDEETRVGVSWDDSKGTPFSLSVGEDDSLWMVSRDYRLWRHTGTGASLYADGAWVEVVGLPESIYRASVGRYENDKVAILSTKNRAYILSDKTTGEWNSLGIQVRDISMGEDGTLAIISGDKHVLLAGSTQLTKTSRIAEEALSMTRATIGDIAGKVLFVDAQGFVRLGRVSVADVKTNFTIKEGPEGSGSIYIRKISNGPYLVARGKRFNEGDESAKEGTVLQATAPVIDVDGLPDGQFVIEKIEGGVYLRHVATGGYLTLGSDGFLRAVNPDNNFQPYTEKLTQLPVVAVREGGVLDYLIATRALVNVENAIGSEGLARLQAMLLLVGEEGTALTNWSSGVPPIFELNEKITLANEIKFLIDDKAERGEPWSVSESQGFNILMQKIETLYGSSPTVKAIINTLKRTLSGVSLVAPTEFALSFDALRTQLMVLEENNAEQFMTDLRQLVLDRIDGEELDESAPQSLKTFEYWIKYTVAANQFIKKLGGVTKILEDIKKPISATERVRRFERLVQVQIGGLDYENVGQQAERLLPGETYKTPDSRLSVVDLRKLKAAFIMIKQQNGGTSFTVLDGFIAALESSDNYPTFETFIEERREEITIHSDDEGMWNIAFDSNNKDGDDRGYLYTYPLREFWGVFRRYDEWNPKEKEPGHMVPLKILLRQVKASVDSGLAGDDVQDIGREASSLLDRLGG